MSLAVNCFVLLLTQYLSFEGSSSGQVLLLITKQTLGPLLLAGIAALITILPLKLKLHKRMDDNQEGHSLQGQLDIALMLSIPAITYLVAESLKLSGMLSMVVLCCLLRLYGRPNMEKDRSQFLKIATTSLQHIMKLIAYVLIGFSLPLHFNNTQTSYVLASITVVLLPALTAGGYYVLTNACKVPQVNDWYRFSIQTGLISYMLALQTFQFKVMHLVLLVSCFSFLLIDKAMLYMTARMPEQP